MTIISLNENGAGGCLYLSSHHDSYLFFIGRTWPAKYRKSLIVVHLVSMVFVLVDIFIFNLRGVLVERIIFVLLLLSASLIFASYRKTLNIWQKLYFGFFLNYPLIAGVTYFIDKIMFMIVASPLIVALTIPATKFNWNPYELREASVGVSGPRITLVKKGLFTERHLGTSNDEYITSAEITGLSMLRVSGDTTVAAVQTKKGTYEISFY